MKNKSAWISDLQAEGKIYLDDILTVLQVVTAKKLEAVNIKMIEEFINADALTLNEGTGIGIKLLHNWRNYVEEFWLRKKFFIEENPYKSRYGVNWGKECGNSTKMKPYVSIIMVIEHMFTMCENLYKET